MPSPQTRTMEAELDTASTWYKDAIVYELHVRSFMDGNGDGVGDFPGLIEKLDYLRDLGVTAIWLLPFYPSPLKDDGYDIANYVDVNPSYGTLQDIRRFIKEAHRRGLKVITELVCNHTSDQHPWFQRARRANPGSPWRDFYVWSPTNQRYEGVRIIFKDFETSNWTWDHLAGAYYWHRFFSHQPDLNFDNPRVRKEITKIVDFWLEMGVDGLRLDAVPYLFVREGTTGENLAETHDFLRQLRRHVDSKFPNRMLLAEANQWPDDAVAYFGLGDECHMCFHFPLMPRLFMALHMEDRFPVVDILAQTPEIPESSQWGLFLRNHDELTLEMVTDEERDFMYQAYTQSREARLNLGIRRRLAPLMGNNRRRIELMKALLFSLPGTPFLYYGDEIGMGDNIYLGDRHGVRTPMQWSADRNAGFSDANRQRLNLPVIVDPEYHYESINVEAQLANPQSLLGWVRRLIKLRKRYKAFGRGTFEPLRPENRKVLAFIRRYGSERILVVANLSRFAQGVDLDLREFDGLVPVEIFGRNEFPQIGPTPYFLSLGPHNFLWFSLEARPSMPSTVLSEESEQDLPELMVAGGWHGLADDHARQRLEEVLPSFLQVKRWFAGKARRIRSVRLVDTIAVPRGIENAMVVTVEVLYVDGTPEIYVLPIAYAGGERAKQVLEHSRGAVIARVSGNGEPGILYDALVEPALAEVLLDAIGRRRRLRGEQGDLVGQPMPVLAKLRGPDHPRLNPERSQTELSSNSIIFGERLILKLFRRIEEGINPELEVGRFLTEHSNFVHIAPLAGAIEYRGRGREPVTLAVLQTYVPNQGDAWGQARRAFDDYLQRWRQTGSEVRAPGGTSALAGLVAESSPPASVQALVGHYLQWAALLGRRTAEMHLALASHAAVRDPYFAPEPSTMLEQRSVYQSTRGLVQKVVIALKAELNNLPISSRPLAEVVIEIENELMERIRRVLERPITASRIRCHGDFHLGQVLWTGRDYVIVDFEGEPARSLPDRRLKRWALRDVAGMMRSFDYAGMASVVQGNEPGLEKVARAWTWCVSETFLRTYFEVAGKASFISQTPEETMLLLDVLLLEKALYEVRYELNNRPAWVSIPLRGIVGLMHG